MPQNVYDHPRGGHRLAVRLLVAFAGAGSILTTAGMTARTQSGATDCPPPSLGELESIWSDTPAGKTRPFPITHAAHARATNPWFEAWPELHAEAVTAADEHPLPVPIATAGEIDTDSVDGE